MKQVQDSAEEAAEKLAQEARKLETESLRVLDTKWWLDEDANGEVAAMLQLVLPDPPKGSDTWPLDEVLELHEKVDDAARSLDFPVPWHVSLRQETVEEPDPEEDWAPEG